MAQLVEIQPSFRPTKKLSASLTTLGELKVHACRDVTAGHWNVTAGHWDVTAGHWDITAGHWDVTAGHWDITAGHWDITAGHWDVTAGHFETSWALQVKAPRFFYTSSYPRKLESSGNTPVTVSHLALYDIRW